MDVTFKPLTKRQREELQGYVAWSTTMFRGALFVGVVAAFAWFLRLVLLSAAPTYPRAAHPAWWLVPTVALAAALFRVSRRWTGGRDLRRQIRADLGRGEVEVRRVEAIDAIEVEEEGDAGPTFFLLSPDGKTLVFAGQYLEPFVRRGFPWQAFDILETPEARRFLGLVKAGERLKPSCRRAPLTWDEVKAYSVTNEHYRVLDCDFATLKTTGDGPR